MGANAFPRPLREIYTALFPGIFSARARLDLPDGSESALFKRPLLPYLCVVRADIIIDGIGTEPGTNGSKETKGDNAPSSSENNTSF